MQQIKQATGDIQQYVIDIEKDLAKTMGPAIDDLRAIHGDRTANEILASVCALLSARAIAMIHIWTGEPVESVAKRVYDTTMANTKPTINKIMAKLAEKETPKT